MRLRILLILCFSFFVISPGIASSETVREMDLQSIGDKTNRSFSPVTIPASACLDDAFLYINFKEGVTNVSISITNQETGITTFIMTIKEIPLYSIPLMEMESGIYRLEMIIDGLRVYGDFDI